MSDYIEVKGIITPQEYDILYFAYLGVPFKVLSSIYKLTYKQILRIFGVAMHKMIMLQESQGLKTKAEVVTICQLILTMHSAARINNQRGQMETLKRIYIKAKKMNRKLYRNKYGKLPDIPQNSWKEEDWYKDLERR